MLELGYQPGFPHFQGPFTCFPKSTFMSYMHSEDYWYLGLLIWEVFFVTNYDLPFRLSEVAFVRYGPLEWSLNSKASTSESEILEDSEVGGS